MPRAAFATLTAAFLIVVHNPARAQDRTVGLLLNEPGSFAGYTLIAPHQHPSTYLVDMDGMYVNVWEHEFNIGSSTYLLENGNLLRASRAPGGWTIGGGRGGRIEEITWDGDVVWQFDYVDSLYTMHHDIVRLPGGNILATVWELRSPQDVLEMGIDPSSFTGEPFWTERIVEFRPILPDSAEIVWQWDAWDHLIQDHDPAKSNYGVVSEHPERIDINTGTGGDWLHINAIDFNAQLDLIAMSISFLSEIWVIDHSTTTEEAAERAGGRMGLGGDLLYRWGNPAMYKSGGREDRTLFFNHSTGWIGAHLPGGGNLMVFDNGRDRPDMPFSTVYELDLPYFEDYDGTGFFDMEVDGTFSAPEIVWSYANPGVFYSNFLSGQQRLPNGNTLIAEGMTGRIFELAAGQRVWEYVNPVVRSGPMVQGEAIPPFSPGNERQQNTIFRAYRYAPDYPGLAGKDLSPKGTIEFIDTAVETETPAELSLSQNYPNPFNPTTTIAYVLPVPTHVTLSVYNALGQRVTTLVQGLRGAGRHSVLFNADGLASGLYLYRLEAGGEALSRGMLLGR